MNQKKELTSEQTFLAYKNNFKIDRELWLAKYLVTKKFRLKVNQSKDYSYFQNTANTLKKEAIIFKFQPMLVN